MTVKDLVIVKLKHVKLNYSIGTFNHYNSHLMHFLKWCDANNVVEVSQLDDSKLIDYITDLKKTCENITINKRIGILKRAFNEAGIVHPYLSSIKKFKETTKTFDMIDYDLLKYIRKYTLGLSDLGNNLTIKCVILLLIDTGARANELIQIEKKNVDLENLEILLTRTKTKENRIVYFTPKTSLEIKKMLSIKTKHKYLLHNQMNDRPVNYFDIDWIMGHYKKVLRIEKLHAHMFRHSLASILLEHGADIKSVMELLGHRNLETTERYLHMSKDHVKKTYMKNYKLDE